MPEPDYTAYSVSHEQAVLTYHKAGNGRQALLTFHGFGQDYRAFGPWVAAHAEKYTFYSFNLFFHAQSTWGQGEVPLEKHQWKTLIALFLQQHHLDRFSVAGFSLGGKFALATLEAFSQQIDRVFLIAPDGIRISPWYDLATYPFITRRFFKSLIDHPRRLTWLVNLIQGLSLADKKLLRFVQSQMNTQEKRTRVYYSWVVFRHLRFHLPALAQLFNEQGIALTMITGKYDQVVYPAWMNRLLKRLSNYDAQVLEAGHNDLIRVDGLRR